MTDVHDKIQIPGIDHFLQQSAVYKEKRIALVTNNAALTSQGVSNREALLKNGFTLVKLFSPEHGLTASGADGAFQNSGMDDLTGLPVISLYGDQLAPAEKDLDDTDIVLFDIPDVGCRFYTYLWTMTHVMESCASFHKQFIVADRSNPISGNISLAEGPMLDEKNCSSFIGRWSIPIRHSCTLGELATYFAATKIKSLQPDVIPLTNWQRNQMADDSGGKFIPTSPAIQNVSTALLYPGMGLLEGINVNEGRGTNSTFRICGAPWIHGPALRQAFMEKGCAAISCQSYSYVPTEGLYANQNCNGLEFFITDANNLRPVEMGLALLQTIIALYPEHVEERLYQTRANPSGHAHLDKLLGIEHAFIKIKNGEIINTDVADSWAPLMQPFLLY
jgi:uncharacterized protein YbbC (DUF1343 family)